MSVPTGTPTEFLYAFSDHPTHAMTNPDQTQWRNLLENPAAMSSVFGGADPDLSDARLLGIDIAEGGSLLTLKLSVNQAPGSQSGRWKTANAISMELQCLGLEQASISTRSGDSTVSCEIKNEDGKGRIIRMIGPSTDVVIRCGFLRVNHLVPYTADNSREAM